MVPAPPSGGPSAERRRLILNPTSGRADHVALARELAAERGFEVVETERAGHAEALAQAAATDGVDLLAVCGGDGTLHEVVTGLYRADALDAVTLAVVPAGTENIVAEEMGIESLEEGFATAVGSDTRRLDLGVAVGVEGAEPFVMSAIAGLPADASAAATHDLKRRFGSLAFVVGGVKETLEFDGLRVDVVADATGERVEWRGEALSVLIGNLRKFRKEGGQANVRDGLLDVAIAERMPPSDAVAETVAQRLLERDTEHVTGLRASSLEIESPEGDPMTFSLDGEIRTFERVRLTVRQGALRVRAGPEYDAAPE